ncbi:MAG: DUF4350 domain-containing protein [Verrucomicrobiota bacterium]
MNRRFFAVGVLLLLGVILIAAFVGVLRGRLIDGRVYPHYASFRADPLGTRALYETLERLPEFEVRRNLVPLARVDDLGENDAFLILGYPRDEMVGWRIPEDSGLFKSVEAGARLVITVNPQFVPERFAPVKTKEEKTWAERRRDLIEKQRRAFRNEEDDPEESTAEESEAILEALEVGPRLLSFLGFQIADPRDFKRPEGGWTTESKQQGEQAPTPRWRSQFRFEALADEWETVLEIEGEPVVMERAFGKGLIVLASDTYFVSNEAMHLDPSPEFCLWLLGDKSRVVFDETVHGSVEQGGAMKLIRRYRLHGVFVGVILWVILWAWRSGSSLAPRSEDLDRGLIGASAVSGETSETGFLRLLRRSVPRKRLLETCLSTWRDGEHRQIPTGKLAKINEILGRHQHAPDRFGIVQAYREIAAALRRR